MISIPSIQKGNDEPGICYSVHEREKPLRCERFVGPSMLPARDRKGLDASAWRTRSKASLTKLPCERPVTRAFSSTHWAKSSGKRTLSVVLIWLTCKTIALMSRPKKLRYALKSHTQASAFSVQLTAAKRSTRQAASSEMAVDIFESPSRRSVKTMGTSLIV